MTSAGGSGSDLVFKRRDKQPIGLRVKEFFAPRKGWRRGIEYLGRRMQRLPDSPTSIALGFACGVYASFTPFFGFHFVIAAALAWLLRGNLFASAVGTFVGNPITFPFIMGISVKLGDYILGIDASLLHGFSDLDFLGKIYHLLRNIFDLMLPYFIGGMIPGVISATVSYFLLVPVIRGYQRRRRAKLMARAKQRLEESEKVADLAE